EPSGDSPTAPAGVRYRRLAAPRWQSRQEWMTGWCLRSSCSGCTQLPTNQPHRRSLAVLARRQPYNAITLLDGFGGRTATGILKTLAACGCLLLIFALSASGYLPVIPL